MKSKFDMRELMENNFVHHDDIESSPFTPMKVEDDEITNLFDMYS